MDHIGALKLGSLGYTMECMNGTLLTCRVSVREFNCTSYLLEVVEYKLFV